MYICMYVCMYVCMFVCMCVGMYCACVCVCMPYVCMYVLTSVWGAGKNNLVNVKGELHISICRPLFFKKMYEIGVTRDQVRKICYTAIGFVNRNDFS